MFIFWWIFLDFEPSNLVFESWKTFAGRRLRNPMLLIFRRRHQSITGCLYYGQQTCSRYFRRHFFLGNPAGRRKRR